MYSGINQKYYKLLINQAKYEPWTKKMPENLSKRVLGVQCKFVVCSPVSWLWPRFKFWTWGRILHVLYVFCYVYLNDPKRFLSKHQIRVYIFHLHMDRVKRLWYLLPMRAPKVQASLRIRAVSPEPSLLAHTSSESRGNFRQKARSLAPLNGWACAVKICHDGMLEDTNSLDRAHILDALIFGETTLSKLWGFWVFIFLFVFD